MTVKILVNQGPFPHVLTWMLKDNDPEGLHFVLRCWNCHGFFDGVGWDWTRASGGPSAVEILNTLRKRKREHPLADEICPGGPV